MTLDVNGTCKPENGDPNNPSPQSVRPVPTWGLSSRLQPSERAAFSVTSRLLANIVTESLLPAYYIPIHSEEACGVCIILSTDITGENSILTRSLDVFAILPLHQEPVYSGTLSTHGKPIWLLDPLDMIPSIFDLSTREAGLIIYPALQESILSCLVPPLWQLGGSVVLTLNRDPLHWWRKFASTLMIDSDVSTSLAEELSSSYLWQKAVYENTPVCPTIFSPAIEWEQSIIEGHPTHPMHRARCAVPPLPYQDPQNRDWKHPRIRLAMVPRSRLDILGPFEKEIRRITELATRSSGMPLPQRDGCIIVPVYDLQIANIRDKFPDVEILNEKFSIQALGQASIRTMVFPEAPDIALKLSVGIRISSVIRTIGYFSAHLGPRFSAEVVPKLAIDTGILTIEPEVASAICVRDGEGVNLDPGIAAHLTAVTRRLYIPDESEAVIICAALLETGHSGLPAGIPVVQHIMGLDSQKKRFMFFNEYSRLLVAAVVPPLLHNGVGFEAHPQNMLLRLSRSTLTPTGFVMRDLGDPLVHPATLSASTGSEFSFLPGEDAVVSKPEEAAKILYHSLIYNHLQRLARVLRLHGDGSAWSAVRAHLTREIPRGSWLWWAWMDDTVKSLPVKCFMRMKIEGVRHEDHDEPYIYKPVPNLIHYRPEGMNGT